MNACPTGYHQTSACPTHFVPVVCLWYPFIQLMEAKNDSVCNVLNVIKRLFNGLKMSACPTGYHQTSACPTHFVPVVCLWYPFIQLIEAKNDSVCNVLNVIKRLLNGLKMSACLTGYHQTSACPTHFVPVVSFHSAFRSKKRLSL